MMLSRLFENHERLVENTISTIRNYIFDIRNFCFLSEGQAAMLDTKTEDTISALSTRQILQLVTANLRLAKPYDARGDKDLNHRTNATPHIYRSEAINNLLKNY
jgi:hypothetical protein